MVAIEQGRRSQTQPQRSCIACRKKSNADDFFRVTLGIENEFELFDRRSSTGRSAYICPNENCIERACAKDRLNRAFKKPVSEDAKLRLKDLLICKLR